MKIIDDIQQYIPYNKQEEKDKNFILGCLNKYDDIFYRDNKLVHMTASSWIVNQDFSKVLMVYHNIYKSLSWTGGHCDGQTDCLQVAIKEAKEETGLKDIKPITDKIYSIEVLTVNGHIKKGDFVSSHLHINVTYLLQANDTQPLKIKEDENSSVGWYTINESETLPTEEWMIENIYKKLNAKLKDYR